jgi:hypothetical protein
MGRSLLLGFVLTSALAAQSTLSTGSIEGHVFNSLTGAPLRKASVELIGPENTDAQVSLIAESDAEGKFQFTGLPPGTYRLSARRTGFVERSARRAVSVSSGGRAADAEFRLAPLGVISGRVLDELDEPEPDAMVIVFKQVYRNSRKQWERGNGYRANDVGEFRIPDLPPGRYLLQANVWKRPPDNHYGTDGSPAKPKMFYSPVYYQGASTQREALPIEVGPGTDIRGIDFRVLKTALPPVGQVKGKVIGMPPNSTVAVFLTSEGEVPFGGSGTAKAPDYAFAMPASFGQYKVFARVINDGPEAYGTGNLAVTGDVTDVIIAMSPPSEITGRISVAESGGNVNLKNVSVTLEPASQASSQTARSDAAGKLVFPKPFGPFRYTMTVDSRTLPTGCFVQDVKLGEREVDSSEFEIQASGQLDIVLSSTAGTISGSVSDADDKPVPSAIVTLVPMGGKARPAKQSAASYGTFRFTNLRPGKYKLYAWEQVDNDLWPDPEFLKKYEGRAAPVTVGPSETQTVKLRVIVAEEMK